MPVEIKELVIRAVVEDDSVGRRDAEGEAEGTVVEECVRQVLRILKEREEH